MGTPKELIKKAAQFGSLIESLSDPEMAQKYFKLQTDVFTFLEEYHELREENQKLENTLKLKEKLTPFKSACYVCDDKKNILEGPYCPGCAASKGIACRLVHPAKEATNITMCPNCKIKIRDGYASEVIFGSIKTLPAQDS